VREDDTTTTKSGAAVGVGGVVAIDAHPKARIKFRVLRTGGTNVFLEDEPGGWDRDRKQFRADFSVNVFPGGSSARYRARY
jgi:hypothetical protein